MIQDVRQQAALSITSPVGVIAGGGSLPFAVAESLRRRRIDPVILAIRGFCDPVRLQSYRHHWIAVGQFGRIAKLLNQERCVDVVALGTLVRPAFAELRMDWLMLRSIPRLLRAWRGGDNHLLSQLGAMFAEQGFRLLSVQDVAPDLLMPDGALTGAKPSPQSEADIARGCEVLAALSPFDIGQGVVVIDGHVVGVEGIEGTDGLLERIAQLRRIGRIRSASGRGVLVKAPKVGQDLRLDLPALGPKTVSGAVAAGLAGIAVSAGHTLLADAQATVEDADAAGLFIQGITA